jgi:hypothetical protein
MQQPLSQHLSEVLREEASAPGLRLNQLLGRTEGRGLYLVVIILCLPFVAPLSLPGLSTLMGAVVVLLMSRLALGKTAALPAFLGERPLPRGTRHRILTGSIRLLSLLEKFIRPRRTRWMSLHPVRVGNQLLIVLLALLLALPLPSPPFFLSNSLPGCAIILLAASVMEEDGVLIWLAYVMAAVNFAFFFLIGKAVAAFFVHGWNTVSQYLFNP